MNIINAILNIRKYPHLGWFENFMGGHLDVFNVTIYGENAMHWGVNVKTDRFGYICFRLPFRCFGVWWPLYFYVSPNASPWSSTFYLGSDKLERFRSKRRRLALGHNFKVSAKDFYRFNENLSKIFYSK